MSRYERMRIDELNLALHDANATIASLQSALAYGQTGATRDAAPKNEVATC